MAMSSKMSVLGGGGNGGGLGGNIGGGMGGGIGGSKASGKSVANGCVKPAPSCVYRHRRLALILKVVQFVC